MPSRKTHWRGCLQTDDSSALLLLCSKPSAKLGFRYHFSHVRKKYKCAFGGSCFILEPHCSLPPDISGQAYRWQATLTLG